MRMNLSHCSRAAVSIRLLVGIVFCSLVPVLIFAAAPTWWTNPARPVLKSGAEANDYAAVTQGQVKNIAMAAVVELNSSLAQFGGAGQTLNDLAAQLSGTKRKSRLSL